MRRLRSVLVFLLSGLLVFGVAACGDADNGAGEGLPSAADGLSSAAEELAKGVVDELPVVPGFLGWRFLTR